MSLRMTLTKTDNYVVWGCPSAASVPLATTRFSRAVPACDHHRVGLANYRRGSLTAATVNGWHRRLDCIVQQQGRHIQWTFTVNETVKIAAHCRNLMRLKLSVCAIILALWTRRCVTSACVNEMPVEFDSNNTCNFQQKYWKNVAANSVQNLTVFDQYACLSGVCHTLVLLLC